MKYIRSAVWGFLSVLVLVVGYVPAAFAVDNGRIQVNVPSIGQTSLKLFDTLGAAMPSSDPTTFANLKPGGYTLRSERDGKVSETKVAVEENQTCMVKVDDKGDSELVRCLPVALVGQQQQRPWTFGVLGGWKETPFDTRLNTTFGNGSADLEESGGSLALEARYNFRRRQQNLGAEMFLYGTYVHYFGTDLERLFLDVHGAPGNLDTGAGAEEKNALQVGVGGHWNLAQRLGMELMLGAHATRVKGSVVTLESQGGGTDLRFSRNKTLVGPMLALGLTYPLLTMQNGHPLNGVFRWTRTWMPDFNVSGSSAFSGGNYDARINGGAQDNFQLGVLWNW